MKTQRLMTALLLLVLGLLAGDAHAADNAWSGLNYLKDVFVKSEDEAVVFRVEFQKPPSHFKGPSFYQKSVQIDIADAYIKPSKRLFATEEKMIPQVLLAQYDPSTVRVRFVLGEDSASAGSNGFHVRRDGRFLEVRVDRQDILDRLMKNIKSSEAQKIAPAAAAKATVKPDDKEVVEEDVDEDQVNSTVKNGKPAAATAAAVKIDAPDPKLQKILEEAAEKKKAGPTAPKEQGGADSHDFMESGLKMFTMLAVVLGIMFILLYVLKKYVFKSGGFGIGDKPVHVLGSTFLAPRKSIALVEVAGDVLVLGISNDNISLLSTIHEQERIEQIKSNSRRAIKVNPKLNVEIKDVIQNQTVAREKSGKSGKNDESFARYVKQFDSGHNETRQTVANVTAMLQKKLGQIQQTV